MSLRIAALSFSSMLFLCGTATAQHKDLVPDEIEPKSGAGWVPELSIGASLSFSSSSQVIGAQDGETWNIGPQLDGALNYFNGPHEWRNSLQIRHVQTRTPIIDEFVKTVDTLSLESIYLYQAAGLKWLGPYGKLRVETSLLPGEDVRALDTTYAVKELDGTVDEKEGTRLELTEAFAPLTFKQSGGLFMQPSQVSWATLEIRVGSGAKEVITQSGLAIADDEGTDDVVEVNRLEDYQQIGGEVFMGLSGTVEFDSAPGRPLSYGVSVETLLPLYSSTGGDKKFAELIGVTIEGKLAIKVFTWMSLDWALKAVREPLLLDEFQIQNSVLLNFSYALVD